MTISKRRKAELAFTKLPKDFSAHGALNTDENPHSYSFFQCQSEVLTILARNEGFDLSKIVVKLCNEHELTDRERQEIYDMLGEIIKSSLRETDQVFNIRKEAQAFDIVLPGTRVDNAQYVIEKIRSRLKGQKSKMVHKGQYVFSIESLHEQQVA